ncbi:MAG TPA: ornithine carbamoyltransferase [Candidatus Binatia bacterium]|nr:ornithine carbamoyltransferase [Candidatus Binatia bacterium]
MNVLGRLRGRDFLDFDDLCADEVTELLDLAARMKAGTWTQTPLSGRSVAILFQKPSVRTRVSFHVGVRKLGGDPITLQDYEVGLGTRETPADVGRVLERYVDVIVARLNSHRDLLALAEATSRPVVNALTDASHPCQVLADLLTIREAVGRLDGSVRVAFVGDGNNVVSSLMEAATLVGFPLTVVSPPAFSPPAETRAGARGVTVTGDLSAIQDVDVVYTDVWASMGQEKEAQERRRQFAEYQVNRELLALAPDAVFMHCLPAHRGEEVTDEVIDSPRSIVFDQAENRLWAQMALLAALAGGVEDPVP